MRIFFFLLLFILPSIGHACDCEPVKLDSALASKYDLIFEGEVVAVSGCDVKSHVKFLVNDLFRGSSYPSLELEFDCSSDCQLSFAPGEHWIIYADYVSYGKPGIDFCSLGRRKEKPGVTDHYAELNGMSYDGELKFLQKNFGKKPLLAGEQPIQQLHENIKPTALQQVLLLITSIAGVILFYYVVRRMLK